MLPISINSCFHTLNMFSYLLILLYFIYLYGFQCVFSFSFTDYPGPPRLALLSAEPGHKDQLKNNKILLLLFAVVRRGWQKAEFSQTVEST